ncbi:MAG: mechanosensitive ion channel family protein [bacterium]
MDPILDGKHFLNPLVAEAIRALRMGLKGLWGSRLQEPFLGSLTWGDLAVISFFIILAALANTLIVIFLHRKMKEVKHPSDPTEEAKPFAHHYVRALGAPIYLLIWVFSVYMSSASLLMKFGPDEGLTLLYELFDKLLDLSVFAVLLWLFFRVNRVLETRLAVWAAHTPSKLDDLFVPLLGKSLRIIVPVMGIIFMLPILNLPEEYSTILAKASSILLIVTVSLILCQVVNLAEKTVLAEYDINVSDNLRARKVYTQVHVISKTLYVLIILFSIASVLMLFAQVRHFGASILASAGVVGVILGFAAQKMIANLFAGFQLAMTQPIRLDDVVIVEGEWGRVEEISLTYVIIHIWDDRRLVVPLSYFIEKPFQNWTRTSAALLGSVFVWTDYTLPLDKIREALKEMIETHPLWDKRFWNLQVTDATERTMQIRVLATAADSSNSWDLRCAIREKLIAHIQENYPQCLPQFRASLFPTDGAKNEKPLP